MSTLGKTGPPPLEVVCTARRSPWARWFVVLGLVSWGLMACGQPEPWKTEDPAEALRLFVAAVYQQRPEIAWPMLPPEVQVDLEARARTINTEAGAEVVTPQELLSSSGFLGPHHIARIEKQSADAREARMLLKTHDGQEFTVGLRRVDEVWRVDTGALPTPGATAATSPLVPADDVAPEPPVEAGAAPDLAAPAAAEGESPSAANADNP